MSQHPHLQKKRGGGEEWNCPSLMEHQRGEGGEAARGRGEGAVGGQRREGRQG